MPNLYEYSVNAENKIDVDEETAKSITYGTSETICRIVHIVLEHYEKTGKACTIAFDGNYCVNWSEILKLLEADAKKHGISIQSENICGVFKSHEEIAEYRKPFLTDDPAFGYENQDGLIQDIMDMDKVADLGKRLTDISETKCDNPKAYIVWGSGSAIKEIEDCYATKFYFEMTKDPIMWSFWGGKLVPFGYKEPDPNYIWKDLYYIDFHLLDNQKWHILETMDYFVDAVHLEKLTLIPRKAYDTLITTLLQYPIKQVKIFMPGEFGAYRFKQIWDVPGLDNSAWNNISSPKLDLIIEIADGKQIRLPSVNLLQYGDRLVGKYWDEKVPKWWPLLAAIDDGYFPDPETPLERTAMTQHLHPSTEYVRRNFNEQFGRYETYYILEAYENSATIMGFQEHADLEEWERKCFEASKNIDLIPDWKDYVKIWPTAPGDLFLIPPGTTHGHGGRQMVLELDTNVNTTTCEYSFYTHDYGRNSWDDETKTMTAPKCRLHCKHGFAVDRHRRENWVKDNLRARPIIQKWTPDYSIEQYTTLPEMPFHIERFHFKESCPNDTQGKFMNVVTLTVGDSITIRSKSNPKLQTTLDWLQAAAIPATFGEYEFINNGGGTCTVVQIRMKKG